MMFSGTPKLDMPPIDFKLHKIRDKELLDAISQQKSRYDYAVKVKEYSILMNLILKELGVFFHFGITILLRFRGFNIMDNYCQAMGNTKHLWVIAMKL